MENERLLSEQEIYDIIARLDVAKFQSEGIVWPLFEAQDAKSIAARDKWWVEQIEGIGNDCEILACANECLNIKTCKQWQSLKQSILNAGKN